MIQCVVTVCIISFMLIEAMGEHVFPPLSVSNAGSNVVKIRKIRVEGFAGGSSGLDIAVNREPLVVTHTAASSWPALQWNLRDLSTTTWTTLYDVLSMPIPDSSSCPTRSYSRESIFYMHDSSADSAAIKNSALASAQPPKLVKEMSLQHFLDGAEALSGADALKNKKLRRLMYSDNFAEMEAELQLGSDSSWRDFLINELDCTANSTDSAQCDDSVTPSPLFNMLHPGVVLQARFTEYHTMRVQLQGRAVYHLFPPHYANTALHVYPSVHRCANQAQVKRSCSPLIIDTSNNLVAFSIILCRLTCTRKAALTLPAAPTVPPGSRVHCFPHRRRNPRRLWAFRRSL